MKRQQTRSTFGSRWVAGWVAFWLVLGVALSATASDRFRPDQPVRVITGPAALPWERVEVLEDPHPDWGEEVIPPGGGHFDAAINEWFGTTTPRSRQVLLHCARGYAGKTLPHPILLVHGANDNANRAWQNPWMHENALSLPPEKRGFAFWLAELGYPVFAVTFAHRHGCNIRQAEQIANAIARIRVLLHRQQDPDFQVDLIVHSKGGVAARLYCSDAPRLFPDRKFLTSYRNDVRTLVLLGVPLLGIDAPFRYYGYNLLRVTVPDLAAAGPTAVDGMLINGVWHDYRHWSYAGQGNALWPGQAQCLFNLVRDGGLPLMADSWTTADGNLTMQALYHGGRTLYLASSGIDRAIARGERLMYRLEEHGLDPRVEAMIVAGTNPIHDEENCPQPQRLLMWMVGLLQAMASPTSDGVVFLRSATATAGLCRRGARLLDCLALPLHHLDLGRQRQVVQAIDACLLRRGKGVAWSKAMAKYED